MRLRMSCAAVGMTLLYLGVGCNGGNQGPALVPVRGTITLDGKPAGGVVVVFHPADGTKGQGGDAQTDLEGRYELKTRGTQRGIAAGQYAVTCSLASGVDGAAAAPSQAPPRQYSDPQTTTLKATVPPEGAELDFPLKSK